jgi:hypothetical protein
VSLLPRRLIARLSPEEVTRRAAEAAHDAVPRLKPGETLTIERHADGADPLFTLRWRSAA